MKRKSLIAAVVVALLWAFRTIFKLAPFYSTDILLLYGDDGYYININSTSSEHVNLSITSDTTNSTPHKTLSKGLSANNELNYSEAQAYEKPKLVLHVGPLKTGSTSVQLNVIRSKRFRPLLHSDNYQEIVGFEYDKFDQLLKQCLIKGSGQCDYQPFRDMEKLYKDAYYNAMTRAENATDMRPLYTLHTDEDFSILPRDEFTLGLLQKLFQQWDVHVMIFYRPLLDWLPSMYSQYRKYFVARPRDRDTPFVQTYLIERDAQMSFPQYFEDSLNKGSMRDSLATYEYYDLLRERLGLAHSSSFNKMANRIQVEHMYAPEGIEKEFTCNLPAAKISCLTLVELLKQGYKFPVMNKSAALPLNLDLLIVEAWYLNLVSIKRHDAAVLLQKRMAEVNMTMKELPQSCLSQEHMDWVWKRHLEAHRKFVDENIDENSMRYEFESKKHKLCSVNAKAAFELGSFRLLFESCTFHSPTLLSRTLGANGDNPKWTELKCDEINITSYSSH
jgi:hypothetical protein